MKHPVTLVFYSRFDDDLLREAVRSATANSFMHFDVRVVMEIADRPSSQNWNAAMRKVDTRYVLSVHSDVRFLETTTIRSLGEALEEDPSLAVVSPIELATEEALRSFRERGRVFVEERIAWTRLDSVVLGTCCMMFDRERVGDLRWNESLPGRCGGAESEWCATIHASGMKLATIRDAVVYHLDVKPEQGLSSKHGYASDAEMWAVYREHGTYLGCRFPEYFGPHPTPGLIIYPEVKIA